MEEATHPRSSKNSCEMSMFPSFPSRHGFLFDFLALWLPSSAGVIARSSPARPGWSQGVSLCRRSVGLSDWKKAPSSEVSCLMSFLFLSVLIFIGFRKIRFGLGSVDERQT